ncbi:MAG: 6,7-dimethyl-8-ribityllumazine synthase [Cytophagaceae bacterium]|nr:6,7-dimethyl-8-ribityllumazine synthase [Cytophagaceae bacterium]MDW8456595.1 6,7-dimethyl-8-ribityllumazine synthase [Cytophagaceae bacterium]
MASSNKHLSSYSERNLTDISKKKFALIVSEWNSDITEALYMGAYNMLIKHGASKKNIIRKNVPGSFELPLGAQWMAKQKNIDAVICLGCLIQGETRHFDFICQAAAYGITQVSLKYNKPVVFGVLTTNNKQQAYDRAGGKYGNKGDEAAITAIKMMGF